jgi:DNA polymerase-3 subunit epsilon
MPSFFRNLQLRRPLAVLDVESTGPDPQVDRIVELALLRFRPNCRLPLPPVRLLLDPGMPIPPEATAVHAIRDEDVAGRPAFADVAPRVRRMLEGHDLAGFNVCKFDLPLLVAEFRRCGLGFALAGRSVVDVMRLFHRQAPRDLGAAVSLYLGRDHTRAHSAQADALASVRVLDAMLGAHEGLARTPEGLHELLVDVDLAGWFRVEAEEVVFSRGKHRGRPLPQVARQDPGYLSWLLGRPLLDDARALIERALADAAGTREGQQALAGRRWDATSSR